MSSHPTGLRFSSYSSATQGPNNNNINNNNNNNNNSNSNNNNIGKQNMQQQQQQINNNNNNNNINNTKKQPNKNLTIQANSLSGSETDLSTSTENLSMEERYVLRHTARVEPQGQENLQETSPTTGEN